MPLPYMPSGNDRPHGKAGYPPCGKPIVGADSISTRGVRGAAGLPGRDESRPYEQILRFVSPGWPRRFPRFVGEGHGPPVGVCGGAGFAVSRLAAGLAVVRRGGIYPSRGCSWRRGGCGRGMPLPYMPSGNDQPHGKAGYPPGGKPIVGADSISTRGVCGAARLPGRDESRPYEQILRFVPSGWPRRFPRFVGEGFIPPAGVRGGAGVAGGACPPLHAFRQRPVTWEGRIPARRKTHCRGGFHIRPGCLRCGGVARAG